MATKRIIEVSGVKVARKIEMSSNTGAFVERFETLDELVNWLANETVISVVTIARVVFI